MQTVTRKLITGTVLSLSAVVMLLLFSSTQVMAAGDDTSGNIAKAEAGTVVGGADVTNGLLMNTNVNTFTINSASGTIILGTVASKDAITWQDDASDVSVCDVIGINIVSITTLDITREGN
ncbi:MAG TPA: hypothetical protein EYM96_09485 [Rhodospirillales bacterium]|nr:hypothetical protein [Rhodospirillales bacterium]